MRKPKFSKDYYSILGLSPEASLSEIKKAWRSAARAHHPDQGGDEAQFKLSLEAFMILGDEEQKAQYDSWYKTSSFGSVESEEKSYTEDRNSTKNSYRRPKASDFFTATTRGVGARNLNDYIDDILNNLYG